MVEPEPKAWIAGVEMAEVNSIENAWLVIENDKVVCFGEGEVIPFTDDEVLDCNGGMVMPAFCDSHTHLVYAGSREREYEDKIRGLSYEEIARRAQNGDPLEFGHTLELLIGGQLDAGFVIVSLYEDRCPPEDNDLLGRYISTFIATRADKSTHRSAGPTRA